MLSLFIGAGASQPFGFPTTKDFIKTSNNRFMRVDLYKDIYEFHDRISKTVDIELILWDLRSFTDTFTKFSHSDSFNKWFFVDSERLFYRAHNGSMQKFRETVASFKDEAEKLANDINKLVYDTYWSENDKDSKAIKIYQMLVDELGIDSSCNIFTTNYDLVIEKAFMDKEPDVFTDGFDYVRGNVYWSKKHYKDGRLKLFKLHGSINWKRQPNGDIFRVPVHDFTRHDDHVIIYPGFKGVPKTAPFTFMHDTLAESLKASRACIFIGFSFRDDYINELIHEVIKKWNPTLQLVLWNPVRPNVSFPEQNMIFLPKNFGNEEGIHELKHLLNSRQLLPLKL